MAVKFLRFALGSLLILNILAWTAVYDLNGNKKLEVIFFDVGQGDAIFIKTSKSRQILIDGGPDSIILEKIAREMPFWDRTIDMIVLTHPEHDHMAGLIEVLEKYKVEKILWTGVVKDTLEFKKWEKLIKEEGADVFLAEAGQLITASGALIEVLHPFDILEGQKVKGANDTSIVLKLTFGNNSFFLTGDISKSIEKKFQAQGTDLSSNVLKIAHHGSKTSSAEEFIAAVSPEISVISVGRDNRYGHPAPSVLEILNKYGINVLRTDINGDIKIISDGKNLKIKNKNAKQ